MWHFYLGTLIPISRTVTETLNSDYEVTLERLIDDAGKWTQTLFYLLNPESVLTRNISVLIILPSALR